MTRFYRFLALLLMAALLFCVGSAESFSLPQNTRIIEAEAFRD